MMLCKADFEEIFPELFKPNQHRLAGKPIGATSPACIARWEDDGGRLCDQLHRRNAPVVRRASDGYAIPDPMRASFALATMPAVAAYGAAWTMLSSFDRMAEILTSVHMHSASPDAATDGQSTERKQLH